MELHIRLCRILLAEQTMSFALSLMETAVTSTNDDEKQ